MAEQLEAPKPSKSKDKSDKKKRKHAEDSNDNASPGKKSKTNGALNGDASSNISTSKVSKAPLQRIQLDAEMDHRRQSQVSTQSIIEDPRQITPKKRRKKPKSSQPEVPEDQMHHSSDLDLRMLSPYSEKTTNGASNDNENPKGPTLFSPSKDLGIEATAGASQSPTAMDVDTEGQEQTASQIMTDLDSKPYIQRALRSILSSSPAPDSNSSKSPFFRQTTKMYLPLSPITLPSALDGLCAEHLSPLILRYYAPLHGVVLSYAHPRFSTESLGADGRTPLAIAVAEYATPMLWVDVDFLLFRPKRGHRVEGMIVLQGESHIGIQLYNLFSGRITKNRLPKDWTWNSGESKNKGKARKGKLKGGDGVHVEIQEAVAAEEGGYWSDAGGVKIQGVLQFYVWDVEIPLGGGKDAEKNLPTIEGILLEEDLHSAQRASKQKAAQEGKQKGSTS